MAFWVAQTVKNLPEMETQVPLNREDSLEKEVATPLQYSCLENSMNRGAWQATVHGTAELDMPEQLIHTQTLEMDDEFCQMLFLHLLRL